jgi:sialic acid synthase SpsE
MSSSLKIDGRPIAPGHPTYIIAAMSGNHNQDFEQSLSIIRTAKDADADAVRIQTYTADTTTI